jgi:hypothetical protein
LALSSDRTTDMQADLQPAPVAVSDR